MEQIDYLCVGHVTKDLTLAGSTAGGTVAYSGRTARVLGMQVAVVTSAAADHDLSSVFDGIKVARKGAPATTTYENIYTEAGRSQTIHAVAASLTWQDVPPAWRSPEILHLGPLNQEISSELVDCFGCQMVGLTPQGWHRGLNGDGHVEYVPWPDAERVLPKATAVVVSREDIQDEETWDLYRDVSQILVVTQGIGGCWVRHQGLERHFPAASAVEVDPTGVGDIFAAAYFVRLWETGGDPWEAAAFATRVAAPTVTRRGLAGIPTAVEVAAARSLSSVSQDSSLIKAD